MIHRFEGVVKKTIFLTQCAQVLHLPILITEQNSKSLGPTVPEIKAALEDSSLKDEKEKEKDVLVFEKKSFSMLKAPNLRENWEKLNRRQVFLPSRYIINIMVINK